MLITGNFKQIIKDHLKSISSCHLTVILIRELPAILSNHIAIGNCLLPDLVGLEKVHKSCKLITEGHHCSCRSPINDHNKNAFASLKVLMHNDLPYVIIYIGAAIQRITT